MLTPTNKYRDFVEKVARCKYENEPDANGDPFIPELEDGQITLNLLIEEARDLLGISQTCKRCGCTSPYLVKNPVPPVGSDPEKVCQSCLDEINSPI